MAVELSAAKNGGMEPKWKRYFDSLKWWHFFSFCGWEIWVRSTGVKPLRASWKPRRLAFLSRVFSHPSLRLCLPGVKLWRWEVLCLFSFPVSLLALCSTGVGKGASEEKGKWNPQSLLSSVNPFAAVS